ncbi:MAG: hypothetical protein Q8K32_12900 [Archangium sp.]|nr:hypothetical protein [Archangium sp.]
MNSRLLTVFAVALWACGESTVELMASAQDLDEGTEITQAQLVGVKVSRVLATPNAVRPEALAPLLGKRLRVRLSKGDLLLASYLGPPIAETVQKKTRGLTLSVSGAENLHAADHVDLLAVVRDPQTNEWVTTTQTQNVIVLSVGKLEPRTGDAAFPLRRATFLLLSEEAESALLAVRVGGLHVALRHPDDIDILEERGRATANSLLNDERKRILEAMRNNLLARGLPSLPPPHQGDAPVVLPRDTAPVPVLPGKQE